MNPTTQTQLDEKIFTIVEKELSTQRRTIQRLAFVGAVVMTGVVVALWITEPRPLPLRLHASLAAMSALGFAWVLILGNILLRKNCPTAWDRIATAWAGLAGGCAFSIGAVAVCITRDQPLAAVAFMLAGTIFAIIAGLHLRRAYRWQNDLRERLSEAYSD